MISKKLSSFVSSAPFATPVACLTVCTSPLLFPHPAHAEWAAIGQTLHGHDRISLGTSVSLSEDGTRLAAGSASGNARIYQRTPEGDWSIRGSEIPGESARFVSLSADGRRVALAGSPADSLGHSRQVRVFADSASGWKLIGQELSVRNLRTSGQPLELSQDGSRLALGLKSNAGGRVRLLKWNGSEWTPMGEDLQLEGASNEFGFALALSADGTRLAVGDPGAEAHGAVSLFQLAADGTWTRLDETLQGATPDAQFGASVALSADGKRLAVGAPLGGWEPGHAYVFEESEGQWTLMGTLIHGHEVHVTESEHRTAAAGFGHTVLLSAQGDRLYVGTAETYVDRGPFFLDFEGGRYRASGAVRAYAYTASHGWEPQVHDDIEAENAAATEFAQGMALSGDGKTLAVGAPGTSVSGQSNYGVVHAYGAMAPASIDQLALVAPGKMALTWRPTLGRHYALETSATLEQGSWTVLADGLTGHGQSTVTTPIPLDLSPDTRRFYRLRPGTIFTEDFETGAPGWERGTLPAQSTDQGDTTWDLGSLSNGDRDAPPRAGTVFGTNLGGNYGSRANITLTSPLIDLTFVERGYLSFWHYHDTAAKAGGQLRVIDEEGQAIAYSHPIEGSSEGWEQQRISLINFGMSAKSVVGKKVRFQFWFVSDERGNEEGHGWYIDDVQVK